MHKIEKILEMMKNINYIQKERGAVFVMTALLLPILFGFMGLAYDVGNLYMHKARLQNVADSAALAGARAFVENGEKIDGNTLITTPYYNNYNYSENDSAPSYNSNHLHSYADIAADAYIIKNIKNLHNSVKADKHSHLVLSNGSQTNPKSFFRVGLTEEVPLYFMPILLKNQWSQTINVEAIASLTKEEGEPPVVPTTTNTIFDNLYTFSNYLNVMQGTLTHPDTNAQTFKPFKENGEEEGRAALIQMTFDGQMVYTGNNASGFYKLQDSVQHMYTSEGKVEQINQNLSIAEMGTNYTNDPRKTASSIDLNDYQDILNSKLAKPHIVLDMTNTDDQNKLTVDNINNLNSSLYLQEQKDKEGNVLYSLSYDGKEFTYAVDKSKDINSNYHYYSYDSNNNKLYYIWYNQGNVPAYIGSGSFSDDKWHWYSGNYVLDENGNIIYYQIQNDDVYFANAQKKWIASFKINSDKYYYTNANKNIAINFTLIDRNALQNHSTKLTTKINTNVFHLTSGVNGGGQCDLNINKELTGGGNINEPLYFIVDTRNTTMNINVYADNKRPIVIIYNSTDHFKLNVYNGATFEGVIYAPNAPSGGEDGVMIKLKGRSSFKGNIVANNIGISNEGPASYTQVNYLKNDTELYDAIINFAKEHGHTFGDPTITPPDNSKPPSNTYNNDWKNWYNKVGQSAATSWFNSLSQSEKIAFWRSWDLAERPPLWRILSVTKWYWDIGFGTYWWDKWIFKDWKPSDDDIQDAEDDKPVTPTVSETKLRLINPRLEENPFHNTASTAG